MRTLATFLRRGLGITTAALTLSCGGGDGGPSGNNFSLLISASPGSLTLAQGSSGAVTLTLVRGGGFAEAVTATVTGLPAGITATVNPSPIPASTTSAVVTVNVGAAVAPATYTATVTASATGVGSATATYQVVVTPAPNYALSVSPASVTVQAGASGSTSVTITRTNFTGNVALSLDNPPGGITGSFNPASAGGDNSALTVSVAATVAPGNYTATIKGSASGPGDKTTTLTLTVTTAANYTLAVAPASANIVQGQSSTFTVNITRTSFPGPVALSLVNPSAGVAGSFNPTSPTVNSSTLTLVVANTVAPGPYTITVMGTASGVPTIVVGEPADTAAAVAPGDRTATFQIMVTPSSSISLAVSPSPVPALQGGVATSTIAITRDNYPQTVNLAASEMPNGIAVTIDQPATVGPSAAVNVTVAPTVPIGSHPITITGSGTGIANATTTLTVTVSAPPAVFNVDYFFSAVTNPDYFAFQNATSAWTQVLPLYNPAIGVYTYRMNLSSGYGGVYYVQSGAAATAFDAAVFGTGLFGLENRFAAAGGASQFATFNQNQRSAWFNVMDQSSWYRTMQNFGTADQLDELGTPEPLRVNVTLNMVNADPQTMIFMGGRPALYNGTANPVIAPNIPASRLTNPLWATRFDALEIPNRVFRTATFGQTNTIDMNHPTNSFPMVTATLQQSGASGLWGHGTTMWGGDGGFEAIVDYQTPAVGASKIGRAPAPAAWFPGSVAGVHMFETDQTSYKRIFTSNETNWSGTKFGIIPTTHGLTFNVVNNAPQLVFMAPSQSVGPFRALAGLIGPDPFAQGPVFVSMSSAAPSDNQLVFSYTTEYLQQTGQNGPNYTITPATVAQAGAPATSALHGVFWLLTAVTNSTATTADGLGPPTTPNTVHGQSFRLRTIIVP